jgi:hypothetical protein
MQYAVAISEVMHLNKTVTSKKGYRTRDGAG